MNLLSQKRYYIIKRKTQELDVGLIFCMFEDPNSRNKYVIYSRDLSKPILGDTKIYAEINKDESEKYFQRIDENIAKHLYHVKPMDTRIHYVDHCLTNSISKGSLVYVYPPGEITFRAFVHEILEIGGCYFYLIHV